MEEVVKLYGFEFMIGDRKYCGHIPAISWQEAQEKVEMFGASVYGEMAEEQASALCNKCLGVISKDISRPQPIEDDKWQEVFED